MKARVPMMIQDPEISKLEVGRLVEDWTGLDEDHYLDGPVTPRVAVVDLNPNTEELEPGADYLPPAGRRTLGAYRVDRDDIGSLHFIQVSVFATVLRTMYLFEEPGVMGRRVSWGFAAPQLLVVPRAGWWANAYYERRSHSLQFFSFRAGGRLIHTSLSRDIVAHETAHALIDGVDPDLYDALDPQSLALHEGIADLTAVLLAFRSSRLRRAVLDKSRGSIRKSTNFSSIGEQFGRAIDPSGHVGWLRNLLNGDKLDPDGDPGDEPEEHQLSQVLTGVLYEFLCVLHEDYKRRLARRLGLSRFSVSGRALFGASEQFKRMVLRGLDYLPPGEVTFADFGRAILAADQASFDDDRLRRWLRDHFVERGIVRTAADLDVVTNVEHRAIREADLDGLVSSAWVAYTFAEANRALLGIPPDAQFEVLPRIVVNKRFEPPGHDEDRAADLDGEGGDGATDEPPELPVKELLFKVRWSVLEDNPPDLGATQRRIQTGATLVIDWNRGIIRSLLGPLDLAARRPARDALLRRLVENGYVLPTEADDAAAQKAMVGAGIEAVVTDDVLRVRGTARLMHVARQGDDD